MEEGARFTEETVSQYRDKRYLEVEKGANKLDWPVANRTAKIAASLLGLSDHVAYRDTILWRKGSRVFNGNILPLGKPSRSAWPECYEYIFGISLKEYQEYFQKDEYKDGRYRAFRELRKEMSPQAIVCFGKEFWPQFSELFLCGSKEKPTQHGGCAVYQQERMILTGHFSRGSAFPNADLDIVVNHLKDWKVRIGG